MRFWAINAFKTIEILSFISTYYWLLLKHKTKDYLIDIQFLIITNTQITINNNKLENLS